MPNERRVNEVVKWLVGGPSDWLAPGVVGLPDRTELINNATGENGRWEINLDMSGDDQNGDRPADHTSSPGRWAI